MTLLLIAFVAGLATHWVYRKLGKAALGSEKWRMRALAKLDHDEFRTLSDAMQVEYRRRFGGYA